VQVVAAHSITDNLDVQHRAELAAEVAQVCHTDNRVDRQADIHLVDWLEVRL
jgi:hypothetical protein